MKPLAERMRDDLVCCFATLSDTDLRFALYQLSRDTLKFVAEAPQGDERVLKAVRHILVLQESRRSAAPTI